MRKPLAACVNGDGRPVHPPSFVLCKECFAVLNQKMQKLGESLGMNNDDERPEDEDDWEDEEYGV